ncbi:type II toxin-antitoxin system RelE/ParE family toxin [Polynucleobacter sp. JS-Polo-80-F4]|uniref:type II toxin-antitoxin system RelE/ParE family toxin n=1 Tax=Polynucleobacter sp. JS-Polo-80-F4 TaxID=2576918 RepID=UPI001C0E2784|nr:type II toxin-antitoxin system RelE/ParE family toxin [Polynucleobacter sp. JS-Polo-80-F4]MBU3617561.1 type II toxin-antitoxin system RelE/ParE family toxin [Polynucleobacter sp. JS-Polo-80-F4]
MLEIRKTEEFKAWLDSLNDLMGRAKIQARIKRLAEGNSGNTKSVGSKVFEMKIDFGPGYRIYYTKHANVMYLLLIGGNKRTQNKDIQIAKHLAKNI